MSLITNNYDGGAFHSSLPKGRATGSIVVSSSCVEFTHEDTVFQVPFDGLRIERGGAANRLIFFSNPRVAELRLYTRDDTILDHLSFQGRSPLIEQIRTLKSTKWKVGLYTLVILVLVVGLIAGLLKAKDPIVVYVAKKVPPAWEEKFGDVVFNQLIAGRRLIHDDTLDEYIQSITDPLLAAVPDNHYTFKFHIVEDSLINAFAIPGGNVIIHTGLILKSDTPEEIAGVLAHEIAHVIEQHSLRQLMGTAGIYLLVQSLLGDMSGLLAVLADNGAFLLTRKYSRAYEQEADAAGWKNLVNARINPQGMVSFFKKLKAIEDEMQESAQEKILNESLTFLRTHPATEDRITRLQRKLDEIPSTASYISFKFDFSEFKESVHRVTTEIETEEQEFDSDEHEN